MLFLALSCLQGRGATQAAEELLALEPDGLQLTPGNLPETDFQDWMTRQKVPFSLHHGFDWLMRRRAVWQGKECLALPGATVHAPLSAHDNSFLGAGVPLEIMYPGYALGCGAQVEEAMEHGVELVVDVSHIYIQLHQRKMLPETWTRLQNYDRIVEVHVSANDGVGDLHRPLTESSFGLGWALEKRGKNVPMVLECYMHRLSADERKEQLEILR